MDFQINILDGVVKMMVRLVHLYIKKLLYDISIDMAARSLTKYRISRYPAAIARYKMLRHKPDTPNSHRFILYRFIFI
jgi:hypothetical protein